MNILDPTNITMARNIASRLEEVNGATVTATELSARFHAHPSKIRGCISLARSMGFPVCSNAKGYFWSTDPKEISKTIAHIEDRIGKQQNAIKGLQEWLNCTTHRNGDLSCETDGSRP